VCNCYRLELYRELIGKKAMVLMNPEEKSLFPMEETGGKKVGISYRKELEEQLFLAAALVFSHYVSNTDFGDQHDQQVFKSLDHPSDPDGLL
jgi:hypothetical protein